MEELNFFLIRGIKSCQDDIFINQVKYVKELLRKHGLNISKHAKTPTASNYKLDLD